MTFKIQLLANSTISRKNKRNRGERGANKCRPCTKHTLAAHLVDNVQLFLFCCVMFVKCLIVDIVVVVF